MKPGKMLREIICGCAVIFVGAGWAAPNIKGTVKDSTTGTPLSGAVVRLVKAGYTSTTGADGKFSLVPTATANGVSLSEESVTLLRVGSGSALYLRNERTQDLRVSVITTQGQTVKVLHDGLVQAGEMTLATPALASGFYLVQLTTTAGSYSVPFLANGAGDLTVGPLHEASSVGSLAKMTAAAAFADTVSVTAAGHLAKRVPVVDSVIADLTILVKASSTPTGMVLIPAKNKTWTMGGAPGEGYDDEYPARQVTLTHDYYMDQTEVTQARWKMFFPSVNPSSVKGDNYPINNVTWYEAVLYCNARSKSEGRDTVYSYTGGKTVPVDKAYPGPSQDFVFNELTNLKINYDRIGYRLATEAEWEFAARGGCAKRYFFDMDGSQQGADHHPKAGSVLLATLKTYAWSNNMNATELQPVKGKLPNPYGLYDIYGNEWEWCNDWALKTNGTENMQGPYTNASAGIDPVGETVESGSVKFYFRVFRGGGFSYGENACNSSFRTGSGTPWFNYIVPGIRTVLVVP